MNTIDAEMTARLAAEYLRMLQYKSRYEAPGHLLEVEDLLHYLDEFEEATETHSYAKLLAVAEHLKAERNSIFDLFHVERKDRSRALNEVDKLAGQLKEEVKTRNKDLRELVIWQSIASGLQGGLNDLKILKTRGKNGFHGRKNGVG